MSIAYFNYMRNIIILAIFFFSCLAQAKPTTGRLTRLQKFDGLIRALEAHSIYRQIEIEKLGNDFGWGDEHLAYAVQYANEDIRTLKSRAEAGQGFAKTVGRLIRGPYALSHLKDVAKSAAELGETDWVVEGALAQARQTISRISATATPAKESESRPILSWIKK